MNSPGYTSRAVLDGCWQSGSTLYKIDGTTYTSNMGSVGGGASTLVLSNGTVIAFDSDANNINLQVDVNGSFPPNTVGRDIFGGVYNKAACQYKPAIGYRAGFGVADGFFVPPTEGDGTCKSGTSDVFGFGCSALYLYQ